MKSSITTGTRNWLFVTVETDAGITGLGEGSGWPRVVETAVSDLAHLLIGQDAFDIERLTQRMTVGMFLAGASFVAVAILQQRIDAAGPGQVHVLWQMIPYLIITTSEVLISITGLEFAYTQAPRAMKSTISAVWLLCVTFGNVLVTFLAPLQSLSLETFFWTFAGLMAAAAILFALLAATYKGKTYLQA